MKLKWATSQRVLIFQRDFRALGMSIEMLWMKMAVVFGS